MDRVLAIDVDGTLLTRELPISDRTCAALRSASQSGYHVVLCTGRQYGGIRNLLDRLEIVGPHVLSDGAVVASRAGEVMERHDLATADTLEAIELARQYRCSPILWGDDRAATEIWNADIEYSISHGDPRPLVVKDLGRLEIDFDPTMALFVDHTESDTLDLLADDLDAIDGLSARRSGPGYVLAVAHGVSKQSGLLAALRHAGLRRNECEVVAFGDSMNDLPMFRESDVSVAMGGAHQAVLSSADLVAPSVENDGVAVVVESLLQGTKTRDIAKVVEQHSQFNR